MPAHRIPLEVRFWSKVIKLGPDECWPWIGAGDTLKKGYGRIVRGEGSREMLQATHVSYEFATGKPVPKGKYIIHSCDNPPCVNPGHLKVGTHEDNTADCMNKGRMHKGSQIKQSRLKESDIPVIRQLHAEGFNYREIGDMYGLHRTTAGAIIRGEWWKHIK